jgi:Raf kinase inhibitor-like YbhB/YbcL family protein
MGITLIVIVALGAFGQPESLSDAVLYGHTSTVQSLIAGGADVNEMDATGMTPLMVAASQGRAAIARILIAAGADVKASSEDGTTALMRAASANRLDVLKLLVSSGADPNRKTSGGMSALMVAAYGGYADAVRALLASRAEVNVKDTQGRTALMAGAASGDAAVVQALLDAGADPRAADAGGFTALTYAVAEGHVEVLDALQKRGLKPGVTELTLAASGCHAPTVRTVLASGVNVNGAEGDTVPLLAAAKGNCVEVVQLLLDRGANVNAKDHEGWTALIKASEGGFTDMVRLLLQRGADMNVADNNRRTAWMYAAMGGYTEIGELFRQKRGTATPPSENEPQKLDVSSPTLTADQPMPRDYTADGRNMSPPLAWRNVPADTKSLAVICVDPDAGNPPPFVHWVIYNLPPKATGLPENIPFEPGAPMPSAIAGAVQGVSGFRRPIYRGPAPPPGKTHHYHFVVFALDSPPDLKTGLTRAELLDAIEGHILARGELVSTYERK